MAKFGSSLQRPIVGALTLGLAVLAAAAQGASAQGPHLSVDADSDGNAPAQLGRIDSCVSVDSGDRLVVDITIVDVQDLLAWEVYFEYDPTLIEIVDHDVRLFQDANPGSAVFDVSDSSGLGAGLLRLAAADTADPPSPDSGSGVLARLTIDALAAGISSASLVKRDLNGDGMPDQGPFLRNADAEPIGDNDDDGFFDGPIDNAQIAIDLPCPPGSQGPEDNTSDGGIRTVYIVIIGLSSAAAAAFAAGLFLYRRRAKAQSP